MDIFSMIVGSDFNGHSYDRYFIECAWIVQQYTRYTFMCFIVN